MIDLISIDIDNLYGRMRIPIDLFWRLDADCSVPIDNYWYAKKHHTSKVHQYKQPWCRFCQGHWSTPLINANITQSNPDCTFPAGLIERICNILDSLSLTYDINDKREILAPEPQYLNIDWREYQEVLVGMWGKYQTMSWSLMTGGGKSALGLGAFAFWGKPGLILVHKKEIQNEFIREADKFGFPFPLGIVGDNKWKPDFCTVAMIQTLHARRHTSECKELLNSAKFMAIDECFLWNTPVLLEDGSTSSICSLVNKKYSGRVMSWNKLTGRFEPKQVTGWVKLPVQRPLVRVRYSNCGSFTCTDNHEVMTNRGMVQAGDLRKGDAILSRVKSQLTSAKLSHEAEQIVYGSLFGDGYLSTAHSEATGARLYISHSEKYLEYLLYKKSFLDYLGCSNIRNSTSGYTNKESIRYFVTDTNFEMETIRSIPLEDIAKRMDWMAVAIMYLDNGSLQSTSGKIYLYKHKEEIVDAIVDKLISLGVTTAHKLYQDYNRGEGHGFVIAINKRDMEGAFGKNVARFTPQCMKYKLPGIFSSVAPYTNRRYTPDYFWAAVSKVIPYNLPASTRQYQGYVYCLEVEGNHNFLIEKDGLVVSNCHHTPSRTWFDLAQSIPAPIRYGQSATILQQGKKALFLEGATGPLRYSVPITDTAVKSFRAEPKLSVLTIDCGARNETYQDWSNTNIHDNDELRQEIQAIATKHKLLSHKMLVFTSRVENAIETADFLNNNGVRSEAYYGLLSTKQRKDIMGRFESGELDCLVATQVFDEGVNIPAINVAIMAAGGKSETQLLQRIGRAIRPKPGDNTCFIYDFFFKDGWILEEHSRQRMDIYRKNKWLKD